MSVEPNYQQSVATLAESKPLIAQALAAAERRRTERLARYLPGMRLKGLEQLFAYLDAAIEAYQSAPDLAGLAPLLIRVRADFQTALEATLSGYQGVASDAMRDVMEIEYLLLDFVADHDHAEEWLKADRKTLMRDFRPAALRDRLKAAGIPPFSDAGFEPLDYQAHSEALHVTPHSAGIVRRGLEPPDMPEDLGDIGFIEMFEHGHRVLRAAEVLRCIAYGIDPGDYAVLAPRDEFDAAHEWTREMQVILIAMFEGPQVLQRRLGREPKAHEVLKYVADALRERSPRASQTPNSDMKPDDRPEV